MMDWDEIQMLLFNIIIFEIGFLVMSYGNILSTSDSFNMVDTVVAVVPAPRLIVAIGISMMFVAVATTVLRYTAYYRGTTTTLENT